MPDVLAGLRIAVTRPRDRSHDLARRLTTSGAVPLMRPAIAIVGPHDMRELDARVRAFSTYDWVAFSSVNAVRSIVLRAEALGTSMRHRVATPKFAAVGRTTAASLERAGMEVAAIAPGENGASLAHAMALRHSGGQSECMQGLHVLVPGSDRARPDLPNGLRQRGAFVDEVVAYRNVPGDGLETLVRELAAGVIDAVTFTSPSALEFLLDRLRVHTTTDAVFEHCSRPVVVCGGSTTAVAARERRIPVDAVASAPDATAMITALVLTFSSRITCR